MIHAARPAADRRSILHTVLVVDDEAAIRTALDQILTYESYRVLTAPGGVEALRILEEEKVDAMLLDVKMAGMDGFEVLDRIRQLGLDLPVIVASGHGNIETAVEAVKKGAYDFLEKPLDRSRLLLTLANSLNHHQLRDQAREWRSRAGGDSPLVGECPGMHEVKDFITRVASTDATVLITGENGTGKELVVRALHAASHRRDKPLVEVNCAAIPKDLVESELFGHEKGSFTGADRVRIGKFEQADGGTLFLDEIGDMSEEAQAKVLKAVEESRFERVGGRQPREVDVRIVAATNRDLTGPDSRFRRDLFYRLNVLSVHLPPLRERGDDTELLLSHFMFELSRQTKIPVKQISPDALDILRRHPWPGNVRELRNLVERLLILSRGETILISDLPPDITGVGHSSSNDDNILMCNDFQEFKARSEASFLQAKLIENQYNVSKTAETLGMQRSNLYKKITRYELQTQADGERGQTDERID